MSAIDKTLTRVNTRISAGEFYEAHQAVRTVVARLLRQRDPCAAVGLLYSSALLLTRAHQTGSAGDLLLYMIKVYEDHHFAPTGANRGRIAQVAYQLDPHDAIIKQLAQRALQWASQASSKDAATAGVVAQSGADGVAQAAAATTSTAANERAQEDLAHVFGTLFVRANNIAEAETYLMQGTRESALLLGAQHRHWAAESTSNGVDISALVFSRGVLGYLSRTNIRNAIAYTEAFPAPDNAGGEFLRLLIPTCQTKDAVLYRKLATHYQPKKLVPGWQQALTVVEAEFFGIQPPRQFNLMDMMGGLMH